MSDLTAPTYLAPLRDELDRLRAEVAELNTRLAQRTDALNRTGASNDTMRATLARIEKYANDIGDNLAGTGYGRAQRDACAELRAILADQEPA